MESITVVLIVGKDGRITIPAKIREVMGISEGDALRMTTDTVITSFVKMDGMKQ